MVGCCRACHECSQNCTLMHQKQKNASPSVTCFIKFMLGDDYLKVLYLPAGFVKKVPNAIDRQSYLEDSTGQRWPVTLSIGDGYLAIQKGWHKFAVDHRLEVGELLLFSYTKGCHFVVQIFGTDGCERLNLASALAYAPPTEQRTMLGENLYPLVEQLEPDTAAKVTGMLLEMDQTEVLHLLESPEALKAKVAEAMEVLRNVSKQQASSPAEQLASLALNE